jgi:hypothetical protein
MANRLGGVQPLWTDINAVLDAMAAEHTERVIQLGQSILTRGVTTINQKTVSLQQTGWANKFIRIPPE